MTKLFISTDLHTGTSGDIVASKELEAIQQLAKEKNEQVIIFGYKDIHPVPNKLDDFPFFIDALTLHKLASTDLTGITLAHFYGGCYPQTIKYLKSKSIKMTYTCVMHNREISIKEHEYLFGENSFPYKHIKDRQLYQLYVVDSIKNIDIVITPGNAPKQSLLEEGAEKVEIIPHGCNIPENNKIKPLPKEFRIGYLGAYGPDKGIRYLINAWESLNYQESTLIFAGTKSESLEPFIRRFTPHARYHLTGFISYVEDFYNYISIYIQPSATEGFGMETIEAMSYGRPVIVSSGAGSADCVANGENGFVVPGRNAEAIAEKIKYFKNHPEEIERMGKNARQKSFNYSWDNVKQRYINTWKNLLNNVDSTHATYEAIPTIDKIAELDIMGIGIAAFGDYLMTDNLLTSIITKTNGIKDKDYQILVIDDGTPDINIVTNLENICKKHKVRLIRNNENRGIPYTFNKIVQNLNTELITIFNNDITIQDPNWLKVAQYFLTQNDKIGTVGFPLTEETNSPTNIPDENNDKPKLVFTSANAAFSFRKSVFGKVINPDNSIGFWEDLVSFFEDTHFCFKLVELGYYNYMMTWPFMTHGSSATFRKYPEMYLRHVDWAKIEKDINGNKNEYISTIKNSKRTPEEYKIDSVIIYMININDNNTQTVVERVNRLQFSRYMFSKYWKIPYDDLLEHANEFGNQIFGDYSNNKTVKWLQNSKVVKT